MTDLPTLPRGYLALNNTAYLVSTTTSFGSPTNVKFLVNSVSNQTTFDNLRIFHLRPDPFDPEAAVWEDVTVVSPDTPAPDFQSRTLTVITNDVGIFVIGTRDLNVPLMTDTADLSVTCTDSTDPIVADNTLTYTVTVHNNGPQTATDVRPP